MALTNQEIITLLAATDPTILVTETEPSVIQLMQDFGQTEMALLGLLPRSFNMLDSRVVSYISEYSGQHIPDINGTTRRELRRTLVAGVLDGDGTEALARRIDGVFDRANRVRSRSIARTETTAAAGAARHTADIQSGVVSSRKWLTVVDGRERRSHRKLHNQVKALNQPFVIGGDRAMYPGGFRNPAETVNCRCVTVPVIKVDAPTDAELRMQRVYERQAEGWDSQLEQDFRRAFNIQREQVMEVFESLT